jgi:hypothetical protein
MTTQQSDLAWRIGGPQGSGVDTAAGLYARACAIGGLHLGRPLTDLRSIFAELAIT